MKHLFLLLIIFLSLDIRAQIITEKYPDAEYKKSNITIPVFSFPEVDHKAMLAEDKLESSTKDVPMRFAIAFDREIDLIEEGYTYIDKQGNSNWLIELNLPGAFGVGVLFSDFQIPDGAELFVFNEDQSSVNGAITSINNNSRKILHVTPVQGEKIYVLYTQPSNAAFKGILKIDIVTHLYRDVFHFDKNFGDSGSCNVNVSCAEGDPWADEIRAVAMIINENGNRWCTGALVNNTSLDGTPYLLTAEHCLPSDLTDVGVWSFIFNYISEDCSPSVNGLLGNSIFGSELRASNITNDFALLELDEAPPSDYDVYYSGWSRSTLLISSTTTIHHPSGDVMKISGDDDAPVLSAYLGGAGSDYWKISDWDYGTTEGGSSGSPLFNPSGKIIGQLRGGFASCSNDLADYYGAFHKSWNVGSIASARLMDWLDPSGDDPNSLAGANLSSLGIEDLTSNYNFSLYPNPSSTKINLSVEQNLYVDHIVISDMAGRIIQDLSIEQHIKEAVQIDISSLSNGVYQLTVIGKSSNNTMLFIKE